MRRRGRKGSGRWEGSSFLVLHLLVHFTFVTFFLFGARLKSKAEVREKFFPGFVDDVTLGKDVGKGVLTRATEKAGGHLV
jgi:hypothetical protein